MECLRLSNGPEKDQDSVTSGTPDEERAAGRDRGPVCVVFTSALDLLCSLNSLNTEREFPYEYHGAELEEDMMRNFVLLAALMMVGCGANAELPPESDLTPEAALPLIHSAASIPESLLDEVRSAGASVSPRTMSTFPLSMLLTAVKVGETEDLRSLWKEGDARLTGAEMWQVASPGRRTLLPLKAISEIEVQTEGDQAKGSLRFRRERMMEGLAEFSAERTAEGWRIVEFRIPAADASTHLQEDGAWKLAED